LRQSSKNIAVSHVVGKPSRKKAKERTCEEALCAGNVKTHAAAAHGRATLSP